MSLGAIRRLGCVQAAALVLLLGGCATNTMTGRTQLNLVSDADVDKAGLVYYSAMVGNLQKEQKLVATPAVTQRIKAITNRLIQQAVLYQPKSADWDWKVTVIDDDKTVNAFCMPGGLMGIYTGLIKQLKATDDEIAQVMGHEIGHALAGHGAEKISMQLATDTTVKLVSAATSSNQQEYANNQKLLSMAASAFVSLPNSRVTEAEADRIGIELAARAGYDPAAAVTLWQKMATTSGNTGGMDFFSTHPAPTTRQETLLTMGTAMQMFYQPALKAKDAPPYDWLGADKAKRPKINPEQINALYSEPWERFKQGATELKGNNLPAYLLKQSDLSALNKASNWTALAHEVLDNDMVLDLNYFYLGRAAQGMGLSTAAKSYFTKALRLSEDASTACSKKMLVSCGGIDVTAGN